MEYEHLFAESDRDEPEVAPINPYVNPPHHSSSDNNFVFGSYLSGPHTAGDSHEYWPSDRLNCNMCQNRQERSTKQESHSRQLGNACEERACENYRKRILHERDPPVKHKSKKNEEHKSSNDQQSDSLSIAGPSRLSNGVSHRYVIRLSCHSLIPIPICFCYYFFSTTRSTNGNVLNRIMQNIENNGANESNTLYHPVLPNTINSQQHSTRTSINYSFTASILNKSKIKYSFAVTAIVRIVTLHVNDTLIRFVNNKTFFIDCICSYE